MAKAPVATALLIGSGANLSLPRTRAVDAVDPHNRELVWNHIWESLNAGAKMVFFAFVTPMMLARWDKEQFGLFAIANASVALMVFLDFGLRTLTRVGLSNPLLDAAAKVRLHALHVAAFMFAATIGLAVIITCALTGWWHRWLHAPQEGDFVIAAVSIIAVATMIVQMLVERIAAARKLSVIKAAVFVGNVLAAGAVFACLWLGVRLGPTTIIYFAGLGLPLLWLLPKARLQPRPFFAAMFSLTRNEIAGALRQGGWINTITGSWLLQSYGLIFVISALVSPAEAGVFFLYLKLSEFLSVLGASACEPTIGALAGCAAPEQQRARLAAGYRSAVALCLTGAAGYAFFCNDLFILWRGAPPPSRYAGLLIGLLGVMTAFSRMITAAALGLAQPRPAALSLLAGTVVTVLSVSLFYRHGGAELILAVAAASALFFIPAGVIVSHRMCSNFAATWLRPVAEFLPAFGIIVLLCASAAAFAPNLPTKALAAAAAALICLQHIFAGRRGKNLFPAPMSAPAKTSRLAYDTRSLRSALVMQAVDLIRPFHRATPFAWTGPCVVSSLAGLGDLFIHLPLIAGIANECRCRGINVRVALRPAHAAVGNACGWDVLEFDNSLEDFFKNPRAIRPFDFLSRLRAARKQRVGLWIELTGNAVATVAIKASGAQKLAARTTRGGSSFIDHPLPHSMQENEYANIQRVADHLGCALDHSVYDPLRGVPLDGFEGMVVLATTTICRWRNWPLANFLALVDRFPGTRFALTGFTNEILTEELPTLAQLLQKPNVTSLFDSLSITNLIRLIAHSRAVVTNDTSTAHLANGFGKSGAVLFGPARPETFALAGGKLRVFADASCPFRPCVQWSCRRETDWCMRKISVDAVVDHLGTLLAPAPPIQAAACKSEFAFAGAIAATSSAH